MLYFILLKSYYNYNWFLERSTIIFIFAITIKSALSHTLGLTSNLSLSLIQTHKYLVLHQIIENKHKEEKILTLLKHATKLHNKQLDWLKRFMLVFHISTFEQLKTLISNFKNDETMPKLLFIGSVELTRTLISHTQVTQAKRSSSSPVEPFNNMVASKKHLDARTK